GAVFLCVVGVAVYLVVEPHRRAVGGETRHAELDVLDPGDTGLHQREVVRIARDQRQVVDLQIAHRVTDVDSRQVQRRDVLRADRDRFADGAYRQRRVDGRGVADRQLDAGLLEFLEALELGGHAITAERQQRRAVQTLLVGDDGAFGSRVEVDDGDGDAGQHAARCVGDGAFDGAVGRLRLREHGNRQQQGEEGGKNE